MFIQVEELKSTVGNLEDVVLNINYITSVENETTIGNKIFCDISISLDNSNHMVLGTIWKINNKIQKALEKMIT